MVAPPKVIPEIHFLSFSSFSSLVIILWPQLALDGPEYSQMVSYQRAVKHIDSSADVLYTTQRRHNSLLGDALFNRTESCYIAK